MEKAVISLDHATREICAALDDIEGKRFYVKVYRLVSLVVKDLQLNLIPTYKYRMLEVLSNLTVVLPSDSMEPFSLDKYVRIGNTDCVYPLKRVKDYSLNVFETIQKPANAFACPQVPESIDESTLDVRYDYYFGDTHLNAYYLPHYYGEYFGYSESSFFGKWYWDKSSPDVIVIGAGECVSEGDNVIVRYSIAEPDLNLIPFKFFMMIRQRVLSLFFETSNINKAAYHFDQFRREMMQVKRNKQRFTYEQIIDSFISGYSSNNI